MAASGSYLVGLQEVQAAFIKAGVKVDAAMAASVQEGTKIFLADAKGGFEGFHARGKPHEGGPKPNAVSGDLRDSIRSQGIQHRGLGEWSNKVEAPMAYARRIELGATGPDSLGRQMNTRAFPYMQPAYDALQKVLPGIVVANWRRFVI